MNTTTEPGVESRSNGPAAAKVRPTRVGIVTAGRTDHGFSPDQLSQIGLKHRRDLQWFPEPDNGLWLFLFFCHAAAQARLNSRPTEFYVIGGACDQGLLSQALFEMVQFGADLIIWWTVTPIVPGNSGNELVSRAFDGCALTGATMVYPSPLGVEPRHRDLPCFLSCGGTVAKETQLCLADAPSFSNLASPPELEPPKVVSWGSWARFRSAWLTLGLPHEALPESSHLEGHTVALWSITATLIRIMGLLPPKSAALAVQSVLSNCCVIMDLAPPAQAPALGFFDPRRAAQIGIL